MALIQEKRIFTSNIEKLTSLKCIWKSSQTLKSTIQKDVFCSCCYCYKFEKKNKCASPAMLQKAASVYIFWTYGWVKVKYWGPLCFTVEKQQHKMRTNVWGCCPFMPFYQSWMSDTPETYFNVPFPHSKVYYLQCPSSIDRETINQGSFDF